MRIQHEALATAATTVATAACTITKIHGFKVAANDRFLQLHDTKTTPANAAVPLRVWPIYGTAPFGEGFTVQPIATSVGATFVVSSTANTYTASAETVDIFVDGAQSWNDAGVTTAGDYTTGTADRTIWSSTPGGKELLRLEFTSLSDAGADLYAKVYATPTPDTGDEPLAQIVLPQNTSVDRFFSLRPKVIIANSGVEAGYVVIDAVAGGYVGDYSGSDYAIKGTYR